MNYDDIKKAVTLVKEANAILSRGPIEYYVNKLLGAHRYAIENHAKLKVGDRAILVKEIDFSAAPGWVHCKHFLKLGALCTVSEVDLNENGFSCSVEFDDESWIDSTGVVRQIKDKHTFFFSESYLEKYIE